MLKSSVLQAFQGCSTLLVCLGLLSTVAPSPLCGAEPGKVIADFQLKDFRGESYSLRSFDESELIAVVFLGTECPLAKLYTGRLERLAGEYPQYKLSVVAINSNIQDSLSKIAKWVDEHQLTLPVLKDPSQKVADLFGATRTPHVFLLDQQRRVRYQGRIDDQYVIGVVRDAPSREDLKVAIDELLAGESVSVPHTEAIGCLIGRATAPDESSTVTYSNQIARIFQERCVDCHRAGEIGPFPMTSYEEVFGWGPMIEEVVNEKRMPPWHADPAHGKFANDRSLTEDEIRLIREWVRHGSPQGDPKDLPAPREYVAGWQLEREPDVVFEMAKQPFTVAADAGPRGIPYQSFWVETGFTEDKWIKAAEAKPSNRAVVHHILVYLHPEGPRTREHSFFAAYVPGLRLMALPEGVARKVPAGSAFRFEMHYTPIGSEQTDLSLLGLIFTDPAEVTHELMTLHVVNTRFELKPETDNQVFTARSQPSPENLQLLAMSPHMHLRGKAFKYEAIFPDGEREVLLNVPHYDFNWQTRYILPEPRTFPAGTRLFCTAAFDNSANNPANPDPSATVRWGDQSWDEMLLGYYDVIIPRAKDDVAAAVAKIPMGVLDALNVDFILKLADKNGDGHISREESKAHPILERGFERIDLNGDGQLSEDELQKLVQYLKAQRPR